MENNNVKEMFLKLKNKIGSYITCKYWDDKKLCIKKFRLSKVVPYDCIAGEHQFIRFVSYYNCILEVIDENENILYKNDIFIDGYKNVIDEDDFYQREKMIFGADYENPNEKISKSYLIKKGLKLINPELEEKWIEFVTYNVIGYPTVILATISYLEKVNAGMSFYDAEIAVYSNEFNLKGFDNQIVDKAISIFCKKSLEYRQYYNSEVYQPTMNTGNKKRTLSQRKQLLIKNIKKNKN